MKAKAIILGLLMGSGCLAGPAAAEQLADHSTGYAKAGARAVQISLQLAIERGSKRSPELAPSRAATRASKRSQRASEQALSSPPRLELAAGPRLGADRGLDASVGLWQDIPLAGIGASRQRAAQAMALAARFQLQDAELQAALAAGLAWVDARAARELLSIRLKGQRAAEQVAQFTAARLAEGAATAGEMALARSLVGSAKAQVLDAEGRLFSAHVELAYCLGMDEERALDAVGRLDQDGVKISEARAFASLKRSPRLRQLAAEAQVARAAAEQSRAEGSPQLSVGPSLTREGTGDWIVLGRVSFPLPVVNPKALETAEHLRAAAVANARWGRMSRRLKRALHLLFHEREHARITRDALATGAVEPARVAHREALSKYSSGKSNLGDVHVAQRNLLDAEERWLLAAADARASELRLLAVTGDLRRPLVPAARRTENPSKARP